MTTPIKISNPSFFKPSLNQIQQSSVIIAVVSAVACLFGVLASLGILSLSLSAAWMAFGGMGVLGGALTAYRCQSQPSSLFQNRSRPLQPRPISISYRNALSGVAW